MCLLKPEARKQSPREQCGFKRRAAELGQRAVQQKKRFQGRGVDKKEQVEDKIANCEIKKETSRRCTLKVFYVFAVAADGDGERVPAAVRDGVTDQGMV